MSKKRKHSTCGIRIPDEYREEIENLVEDSGRPRSEFGRFAVTMGFNIFWKNCSRYKLSSPENNCLITRAEFIENKNTYGFEIALSKLVFRIRKEFDDPERRILDENHSRYKKIYESHLDNLDNLAALPCERFSYRGFTSVIPYSCKGIINRVAVEELDRKLFDFISFLFFLGRKDAAEFCVDYEPSKRNKRGERYQQLIPVDDFKWIYEKIETGTGVDVVKLFKKAEENKDTQYYRNQVIDLPVKNGVTDYGPYSHLRTVFKLGV